MHTTHTHTYRHIFEWFQKWFLGSVPYSNLEKKELPYLIIAIWKIFTAFAHPLNLIVGDGKSGIKSVFSSLSTSEFIASSWSCSPRNSSSRMELLLWLLFMQFWCRLTPVSIAVTTGRHQVGQINLKLLRYSCSDVILLLWMKPNQ